MVQQREGEYDALVLSYVHLRNFPRADEALLKLKKIASLVKPIMRARHWKVSELCEFYPDRQNLLGTAICFSSFRSATADTGSSRSERQSRLQDPSPSSLSG